MINETLNSDNSLLQLIAQDDRQAFEMLYRRYWLDLFDSAYQRLRDTQQAEDIVQDIFLKLWARRVDLKIDNLPAYLHTAVKFKVFNYVERNIAHKAFYEPLEKMTMRYAPDADGSLIEKELNELLIAYIQTLSPKKRDIFNLYFKENLSTKEIAERLNISRKTVQNQLRTVLQDFRAHVLSVLIFLSGTQL